MKPVIAVIGGFLGLVSSVGLTVVSPALMVNWTCLPPVEN
jgi:hypothetical protein